MNKDVVISVENLSKMYRIGGSGHVTTVRDQFEEFVKHPFGIGKNRFYQQDFWALKNVSFEVRRGDVVGVIGRNGSGKSTLLKILSRIVEPTEGRVTMKGRVASLLEVGTGFNGELSGRENIYLNGAILGMSKKEIDRKFDQIVDFSGVEKFIDTPVKRYSSGMYVRLAFSVAAHLDSDILLVDEVLAVGDAEFQKKCLGKMKDLARSGRTIIFVSHSAFVVREICETAIYLDGGIIKEVGNAKKILDRYINTKIVAKDVVQYNLKDQLPAQILSIDLSSRSGGKTRNPIVTLEYVIRKNIPDMTVSVALFLQEIRVWCSYNSDYSDKRMKYGNIGVYKSDIEVPLSMLKGGNYILGASIGSKSIGDIDNKFQDGLLILNTVPYIKGSSSDPNIPGFIRFMPKWKTVKVKKLNLYRFNSD